MAVSFTRFCLWYWSNGKEKDPAISSGSSSDPLIYSSLTKKGPILSSSSSSSLKKVKRKWPSREERRRKVVDKEYDVVVVPSDGVCLSGSDESSYDSDWSIGWMEPHAPEFFQSDDEDKNCDVDNSFAVLVPCYKNDFKAFKGVEMEEQPSNPFLIALSDLPNGFSTEGNKYMEQWLASLQNSKAHCPTA